MQLEARQSDDNQVYSLALVEVYWRSRTVRPSNHTIGKLLIIKRRNMAKGQENAAQAFGSPLIRVQHQSPWPLQAVEHQMIMQSHSVSGRWAMAPIS